MDVVRANIEKFGGALEIESLPGQGTRFQIRVPLTLSILPSVTVEAGGQTFAVPRSYVEEIVSTAGGNLEFAEVGERRFLTFRERRLPCISLGETFGMPDAGEGASLFMILRLGWGDFYALAVDRIFDHHELVIKPLSPGVMECGLFVGCTQLDDGTPVLVLDVAAIGYGAGIPRELHRPGAAAAVALSAPAGGEVLRVVLLHGLDGERRAIAMTAVEQVERVAATAVRRPGPGAQVVLGEEILPLAGVPENQELPAQFTVLRLGDGVRRIAYAAREVLEIATLTGAVSPIEGQRGLAGVTLIEGETAELIDCHALFARYANAAPPALSCRLAGDADGWMRNFLGPIVEAAGYRIVAGDEPADIAFIEAEESSADANIRKAIRLSDRPDGVHGDGIYRYDRAALMAALLRAGEELAA
jgi:two-component system chemotaxis sensor kinase CheA